jgi:phosphate/sulfate permease
MLTLVLCVVLVALAFEFINGFHDTANAIATSVGTKVLTPTQAILLSTVFNLIGALAGVALARTNGQHMVKLQPIHGFAAQTTAAAVIEVATHRGIPLSTTHVISNSVMGVGSTRGLNAVKWTVVERMVWAWLMTIPVTGLTGYGVLRGMQWLGWVV